MHVIADMFKIINTMLCAKKQFNFLQKLRNFFLLHHLYLPRAFLVYFCYQATFATYFQLRSAFIYIG